MLRIITFIINVTYLTVISESVNNLSLGLNGKTSLVKKVYNYISSFIQDNLRQTGQLSSKTIEQLRPVPNVALLPCRTINEIIKFDLSTAVKRDV